MRFGIDRLVDDNFTPLQGKRIGLFTNLSAVDRDLVPTYERFRLAKTVNLSAFFSPEHGLAGMVADGVAIDSDTDHKTGLPSYSLYGDSYAPTADMLQDIDLMVCDIQDIGVRYYTFLWTVTHILEACGQYGVPVMILDRPNPLGGALSGGALDTEQSSLVGRFSIPIRHGLSMGELANLINDTWNPTPAELTIIACEGWQRSQLWSDLGRAFIPPSPNMPHFSTALQYAGACLVEGTELSEGRGTALPFEVVGAPYIDGTTLAESIAVTGAIARPMMFQPTASKFAGQACGGIQLHITDIKTFDPLSAWLHIITQIRHLYPNDFAWNPKHFDRLIGNSLIRAMIDIGDALPNDTNFHQEFLKLRRPYQLYED